VTSPLPPGPHGGDAHRLADLLGQPVANILDLSASLNPVAIDPVPIIARHLDSIRHYPIGATRARAALAEVLAVEPEHLLLTNGGAEAIALVAALHPRGWAHPLDFSLYQRHLNPGAHDGAEARSHEHRWMSDPNNPTGRLARRNERAFVRDEAFYVLATGHWSRRDADTIVVGSLTKAFACPGLRIGYVLCPDAQTIAALERLQPRWSLNGIAESVLPDLLATAEPSRWMHEIGELRDQLTTLLRRFGYEPAPGTANYLWIPAARGLRDRLMSHGVMIRSGASFGHPDAVRIAVPTPDGLARLETALAAWKG